MDVRAEVDDIEILLVDDRSENLLALEAVLSSPGIILSKATSGENALRYLLDHEPAIILMDVQMPGLDGFETASIIKKSDRTREIPIIFITAINSEETYVYRGYTHGAVDYIFKPYDPHILKSKVNVFVDLARKTRRLIRAEMLLRESERAERERYINQIELRNLRREQAEQKRYRDLVEGISQGIVWVSDLEARVFSFISPSATQILGATPDELVREPEFLTRRTLAEDRGEWISALSQLRAAGSGAIQVEHRVLNSRNEPVWLRTTLRKGRAMTGERDELRGLSMDVNKLKQAEEILRRSKDRSDFLAEASLLLAESLELQSTLSRLGQLVVPRFADWHAIQILQSQELRATEWLPHPGRARSFPQVGDPLLRAMARSEEEFEKLRRMGIRSAILAPIPVRDSVYGIMAFASTRPDRKYDEADLSIAADLARRVGTAVDNASLYQQAQAAIRIRDEFLSIASHELKTPLTPLKMQVQMLLKLLKDRPIAELPQEKVSRMLKVSERQVEKLSELVDDLLDVARITNGKLSLDLEDFDFGELVREAVERFCPSGSGVQCELAVAPVDAIPVRLDRFRMEQVVVNLLTNALKYGNNKPIQVTVRSQGERIQLAVKDLGIGVAQEDRDRIFGRFERAVSCNGQGGGGLGLGLYIVSQIIEAHGGRVELISELGQGSTFIVDLPRWCESVGEARGTSVA